MAKRIADPSLDTRHRACLGVNGARGLPNNRTEGRRRSLLMLNLNSGFKGSDPHVPFTRTLRIGVSLAHPQWRETTSTSG
jgi:hypothetical protein